MTTLAPPAGIHIGPMTIPKHTLGLQILVWTAEYPTQPDGPNAGMAWKFTPEQARFVMNWYAIDEHGRFVYRDGMLRRMKGWGKDPVGAALCCVEFVGPCRFHHWEGEEPVAAPHYAAWVQTAAVSRDQTRNTMTPSCAPRPVGNRAAGQCRERTLRDTIAARGSRTTVRWHVRQRPSGSAACS